MKLSQKIQETNPVKYANPRNTKESGCQNRKKIYAYHHSLSGRWQTSIDQKNHTGTHDCTHHKVHNPLQHPLFHGHLSFSISFDYCIIFPKSSRYVCFSAFPYNQLSDIPGLFFFRHASPFENFSEISIANKTRRFPVSFLPLQFDRHGPIRPVVRMIPHSGRIKHPHGSLYRSRPFIFIAVIDHFFDPALNDCLCTFIARKQRDV